MAKDSRDALIIELKDTIDKLNGTITSFSKLLEESHAREAALQEQVSLMNDPSDQLVRPGSEISSPGCIIQILIT